MGSIIQEHEIDDAIKFVKMAIELLQEDDLEREKGNKIFPLTARATLLEIIWDEQAEGLCKIIIKHN